MKPIDRLNDSKGFGIVDVLLGTVILVTVVTVVAVIIQRNLLAFTWNQQTKKAGVLAEMVVQKYQYLSSVQFDSLDTLNQTNVTPAAFFASPNNMGYDGMMITTVADPQSSDGSRRLTVTVSWGQGASQQVSVTKYLSSSVGQMGGAPVYVYVLDAHGNGIPGFEVHAEHHYNPAYINIYGNNQVIGYTDANGYAVLNNVAIDPNLQPMRIRAKKSGSGSDTPRSSPSFSQGYYAPPNFPQAPTWCTKWIKVTQVTSNQVQFKEANDDIRPLGTIAGTLTNASGGRVDGMSIGLDAIISAGGELSNRQHGEWPIWVQTDASGHYEFNNIAPSQVTVHVRGREGSEPSILPTANNFVLGFVGAGGNGTSFTCSGCPWEQGVTMPEPATAMTNVDVIVKALGSLELKTINSAGMLEPGTTVSFQAPLLPFPDRPKPILGVSDTNGMLRLYNLFGRIDENIPFTAVVKPQGCTNLGGYLYNYGILCSVAQLPNKVTLTLNAGTTLTGRLTDTSGNPLVGISAQVDWTDIKSITDSNGVYTLCGVSPLPGGMCPNWPSVNLLLAGTVVSKATVSGTIYDANFPSNGLPGVQLYANLLWPGGYMHNASCANDTNATNVSDTILSGSGGAYGPICMYSGMQTHAIVTATPSGNGYSGGTVSVSTAAMSIGMQAASPYHTMDMQYMWMTIDQPNVMNLNTTQIRQLVSGNLTDMYTGQTLHGVTFDACQSDGCNTPCQVTTDNSGNFGPVSLCVNGRSNGVPGSVTVTVPTGIVAQNTGKNYIGASQTQTLPVPASATTPMAFNFALDRGGGGL